MNRFVSFFIIITTSAVLSCFTTTKVPDSIRFNYKTEGFLDKNNFQILAKGTPDSGLKSLVEKRESALRNAEKLVQSRYMQLLNEYYLKKKLPDYSPVTFPLLKYSSAIQKDLTRELSEYPGYGKQICTYYNEDASAVIVHRISRRNLQDDILGIHIDFEHKDKEKKKK
ncbi:MAG TPA: hypothetical protein PK544_05095 [Spirochaetota bacterium]|nr:hypothetical protein [Spirochaetota bacterium]HPJ37160.1 hypothetical protein [Spirochaetota bacterium]HPQ51701.1 hypothetical protein [Spirochaetota bacterium]